MLLGGAFAPFRYEIIILLLFLLFTEVWVHCRQPQSQPLPEPGADEARRAADALAGRHDAARPGVALAAGSAGRDRPAGRRGPDGAGCGQGVNYIT